MSRPDFRAKLTLEASISPSEDPERVAEALRKAVGEPDARVIQGRASASLTTDSEDTLVYIRDKLRDRHVRSAARRRLLLSKSGRSASLMLNRQAASAGVIAICGSPEESPLGPIYLRVESDKLDAAIVWLTSYEEG